MPTRTMLFLLLLVWAPGSTCAQGLPTRPLGEREVFSVLQNRLSQVAQHLGNDDTATTRLVGEVQTDLEFLSRQFGIWHDTTSDYLMSLTLDASLLERAAAEPEHETAKAILRNVAADIKIKAQHCRRNERGLGATVRVTVNTKRNGATVPGLWVECLPVAVADLYPNATPAQFDRMSTPTTHIMPPGRYYLWTKRPESGRSGERVVKEIGDGSPQAECDVPAPEERSPALSVSSLTLARHTVKGGTPLRGTIRLRAGLKSGGGGHEGV